MTGRIDKILRSTGFAAPVAALVLLFAYTPVCTAHAILVRSIPEQEATVASIPAKIELWFDDGVGENHIALAVIDNNGKRVDNKDVKQGFFDKSYLSATLGSIKPGKFTIRYRVQSADGHIITGKYYFTLQE